jgi:DNA-binding NarL/FixJ family response regulator
MMAIKVLIYEDNNSLRSSAMSDAICVQEDVEVLQPDVILMDIDMPQSNGVDAVKMIRKKMLDTPVVMFTVFEDDENIFNAIRSGANGYLLKKNFDQIPFALKDVLDGGAPMTSSVAKRVLNFIPKNNTTSSTDIDSLSNRETEILEYITKGYSYKMIAEKLFIATETVRTHIKRIYKKLQVNSATEAVYKFTHGT